MIFDDVGKKTNVRNTFLGLENAVLIVLRCDVGKGVPAELGLPEDRAGKVKHRAEITVFADEIRQLLILFIEHFPHRKRAIGHEGFVTKLAEEIPDPAGLVQFVADRA